MNEEIKDWTEEVNEHLDSVLYLLQKADREIPEIRVVSLEEIEDNVCRIKTILGRYNEEVLND